MRVQHPQVHQRTDRKGTYWFFRYWHEELIPDSSIKTTRKFHTLGPSKGKDALTQLEAEARRDHYRRSKFSRYLLLLEVGQGRL